MSHRRLFLLAKAKAMTILALLDAMDLMKETPNLMFQRLGAYFDYSVTSGSYGSK